jgi:excinuclease ABC subunit C
MRDGLTANLAEKLDTLPTRPGCYLFKDSGGTILYVGKAVNLRSRVRSYFQKSANHGLRIRRLVHAVRDLETIVTETELEALVLECSLIKKYQPHYNVRLRDDKHYPYLCVTTSEPFPRLLLTRRVRSDGNRYFGPYSGSRAVYATMELLNKLFPIVSCGKPFDGRPVQKPCLYFHMGQCLAPCAGKADRQEYTAAVRNVIAFLEGKEDRLLKDLRRRMEAAAEELEFELAARLRDQIEAVNQVLTRQKVISTRMTDQDVIALVAEEGGACVQMFYIRGGKLIGQNHYLLEGTEGDEAPNVAVQEFVKQYYQNAAYVPQEILLPCDIDETTIVQSWLRQKRGGKVEITVPVRGDKKRLVEMAAENASQAMVQIRAEMRAKLGNTERALKELAEALGLPEPPRRIECYDISNFQGDHFVGSMVVCESGQMAKMEYRRFKIRCHEGKPDDYAMMREVLLRRLKEARAGNPKFHHLPDLIIVDGGRGQVSSAVAAIEAAGFTVPSRGGAEGSGETTLPVCGLAKRFELLILPNEPDPVVLPRDSQALYLVQRIRDEAHRFANAYRALLQGKKQTRSALDGVPGIGPKRRKALLRAFGSVERLRQASVEEIAASPGMTRPVAEALVAYLQGAGESAE